MRVFTRLSELTWVLPKLRILPEPAPRDVTADEDCADDAPDDTEEEEGEKLDEYPRVVVLDVEEDRVLVAERVDGLQDEGGDQRAEERPPERLQREVVAHFLQAENKICCL